MSVPIWLRPVPLHPGGPALAAAGPPTGAPAVVLLLHGGREVSTATNPLGVAYLRMALFARAVARAEPEAAVWLLRNRYRGWNAPELPPVQDARQALELAAARHPGAPVVLVGHSMGGRVALRVADAANVTGVCLLGPWITPADPVAPVAGRSVLVVHGDRDRVTSPAAARDWAGRAGARYVAMAGESHAMLRRAWRWNALVTGFVAEAVGRAAARP
jgi:alpha-beta hydrolase superfamily lysophospholipase